MSKARLLTYKPNQIATTSHITRWHSITIRQVRFVFVLFSWDYCHMFGLSKFHGWRNLRFDKHTFVAEIDQIRANTRRME
jgi:hypothetical protein